MIKIRKKITNPMTVIAIFAFISESSAALSLPFLDSDEREIYVWFLISFPFYLLLLFFMTLNFNYRSLYAPSDFDKDDSFLKIVDELKNTRSNACSPAADTPTAPAETASNALAMAHDSGDPMPARQVSASSSGEGCQDPPWIEHNIRLPKRMGTLRAIDIRPMSSARSFSALAEHFPRPDKQSARVVLFLTDPASDILFRQVTLRLLKQSKKGTGGAIFIVYNVDTLSTTVLGQMGAPDQG